MKALRFVQKWLHRLLTCLMDGGLNFDANLPAGIDSHRWESKIEILGSLSR
jgi:hypothetical protein